MAVKFVNFLQSRIANVGGIASDALSVDLTAGDGAKALADIPLLGDGDWTYAWLKDAAGNKEVVKVTDIDTDTLTIEREVNARYPARAWLEDDIVHFAMTMEALNEIAHREQLAKDANYTITADDLRIGKTFTNYGATGEVIFSLPAGASGYRAKFIVAAAQYLRVAANGSDLFLFKDQTGAAGGYVRSNIIGTVFEIEYVPGLDQWSISPDSVQLLADE